MRSIVPLLLGLLLGCSQPTLQPAADEARADSTASTDGPSPPSPLMSRESDPDPETSSEGGFEVVKSDDEWRQQLSPEAYYVTRQAGTERPGSGEYEHEKRIGTYHCICCDNPLFRSDAKFDSGCGWPAFFEPLDGANLIELRDTSLGMVRTEIRCGRCDAHLGHVFNDGPPPTGIRYCINSVALNLEPDEDSAH